MKIYYAHAMCMYGCDEEEEEISHIKTVFPGATIVDPGSYSGNPAKRNNGMEFCKGLVSTCDALVFSRLLGKITAGVGVEINHALSENKPVYELKNGRVSTVKKPVRFISRDATIKLYSKWAAAKPDFFPWGSLRTK